MKKCIFCVDWIYNENLLEVDCIFVCVCICLVGVCYFGDFVDLEFNVFKLIVECGGMDLMLELNIVLVNKYLLFCLKDIWDFEESVFVFFFVLVVEEIMGFFGWFDK